MYRQIAEALREQIESRDLRPGSQLPTELELGERYGASRNTVRDAIKWLTTLGLVETQCHGDKAGTVRDTGRLRLLRVISAGPVLGSLRDG
ncbi:MAG: winged helix-turn-helix domain-containing protein [Streptosporangiaceae bacterium]